MTTFTHSAHYHAPPDPAHDPQFYEAVATKRLIAYGIDLLITLCLCIAAVVMSFGIAFFALPALAVFLSVGYRAITIMSHSATWGMRFMGIELRGRRGAKLSGAEAFWHSAIFVGISLLIVPLILNIVMILSSSRGQGLHDLILGTVMINSPAKEI